jgi:hypothetical protein
MILKRTFREDRRRRKRQLLNTSVQVHTGSSWVDALGINLSEVGMCVFTMANLPLGSEVQVEFDAPRSEERVRLCGTVRHRAIYLYGIEFLAGRDRCSTDLETRPITTPHIDPARSLQRSYANGYHSAK